MRKKSIELDVGVCGCVGWGVVRVCVCVRERERESGQIGRFLKVIGNKIPCKSSPNI